MSYGGSTLNKEEIYNHDCKVNFRLVRFTIYYMRNTLSNDALVLFLGLCSLYFKQRYSVVGRLYMTLFLTDIYDIFLMTNIISFIVC